MTPLIILAAAIAMAAHAISTANFMSRRAPFTVALEVIVMFGFSVGAVIGGYNHDTENALIFLIVALSSKCILVLDLLIRGYALTFSLLTCDFDRDRNSFMKPARRTSDRPDQATSP